MAIKSVFLLGVLMAFVLLICQNVAYARVLTEGNGKNVEPTREPELEGQKWFLGFGGGLGQPAVIGGGYQPVYGGVGGGVSGYGGYGYGPGYTGGVAGGVPGYVNGGVPGYTGGVAGGVPGYVNGGVPGYTGGEPGVVPGYVGGGAGVGVRGYGGYRQVPGY